MKFYFIALVFYLISCSSCSLDKSENDFEVPFKQLDSFVNDVYTLKVNIDEIPITEIGIDDKNIIYYLDEDIDSLSYLSSITKTKNGFVFYDTGLKKLYNLSGDGTKINSFANEGRGPGEINGVRHIDENSKHIYISDSGNRRINIYDQQFNFLRSESEIFSTQFYVNDKFLVSENSTHSGVENLISVKPIDDFNVTKTTLVPRLVPLGYQPTALNGTHFSINDDNKLVVAYSAIPWMFIFDEQFVLKQTLVFSKSSFDTLDTWQLEIEKAEIGKSYFGRNPITNISILNIEDVIVGVRNELIILSKNESDMYEPVKRLVFKLQSQSIDQKHFGIYNEVIGSDGEKIFVHNYNYLFWINL